MPHSARQHLSKAKRIVVKVGTAVVTRKGGGLALGRLGALIEHLVGLREEGREVILVSSGSIGLGAARLGLDKPTSSVDRQAAAAAGQGALVALYDELCRQLGVVSAQVLLTDEDFLNRQRYLNLSAALSRLLMLGALPIINENDTVSTAELALDKGMVFGDNDRLSALVAAGLDADLLVILSDVDGLHTKHPSFEGAERIAVFGDHDFEIGSTGSRGGRGGMGAKISAARIANNAGVDVVVTTGFRATALREAVNGDDVGTLFPGASIGNKRQRWLAYATLPAGQVVVNEGARVAMVERKASLLPAGIVSIEGEFASGSVVSVVNEAGSEFARGICARSSSDARSELSDEGRGKALVHRDNIVILREGP